MYKKITLIYVLLTILVYGHMGEELVGSEQHSLLEILLENPTNIMAAAMIL